MDLVRKIRRRANLKSVSRRIYGRYAANFLRREGFTGLFQENKNGAIAADFPDLMILHEAIKAAKPAVVIEYGGGYSTYVIAETLSRLGKGKLYSIELDQEWKKLAASRLPPHLSKIVEFLTPDPVIKIANATLAEDGVIKTRGSKPRRASFATVVFPELHHLEPDFIFIDGPARGQVPGYEDYLSSEKLTPIVSDPLVFCQNKHPIICVDTRREQTAFLVGSLPKSYRVKVSEFKSKPFVFFYPSAS